MVESSSTPAVPQNQSHVSQVLVPPPQPSSSQPPIPRSQPRVLPPVSQSSTSPPHAPLNQPGNLSLSSSTSHSVPQGATCPPPPDPQGQSRPPPPDLRSLQSPNPQVVDSPPYPPELSGLASPPVPIPQSLLCRPFPIILPQGLSRPASPGPQSLSCPASPGPPCLPCPSCHPSFPLPSCMQSQSKTSPAPSSPAPDVPQNSPAGLSMITTAAPNSRRQSCTTFNACQGTSCTVWQLDSASTSVQTAMTAEKVPIEISVDVKEISNINVETRMCDACFVIDFTWPAKEEERHAFCHAYDRNKYFPHVYPLHHFKFENSLTPTAYSITEKLSYEFRENVYKWSTQICATGTFKQQFDLRLFPFDCHKLKFWMCLDGMENATLMQPSRGQLIKVDAGSLHLADWDVRGFRLAGIPTVYRLEESPRVMITCGAARYWEGYFRRTFFVAFLLQATLFLIWAHDPFKDSISSRLSTSCLVFLTLISFQSSIQGQLPKIPDAHLIDIYMMCSFYFVVIVMGFVGSNYVIYRHGHYAGWQLILEDWRWPWMWNVPSTLEMYGKAAAGYEMVDRFILAAAGFGFAAFQLLFTLDVSRRRCRVVARVNDSDLTKRSGIAELPKVGHDEKKKGSEDVLAKTVVDSAGCCGCWWRTRDTLGEEKVRDTAPTNDV